MTSSVSLAAAFLAGLVSFISPCVLPIVPGYLSFISGVNVARFKEGGAPRDLVRRVPGEFARERIEVRDGAIGPENDNHTLGRFDEIPKDCFTLVPSHRRTALAAGSRRLGCRLALALLLHGHLVGLR